MKEVTPCVKTLFLIRKVGLREKVKYVKKNLGSGEEFSRSKVNEIKEAQRTNLM